MKWLGERDMAVADIVTPDDFSDRIHQPHVAELAESIGKRGLLNRLIVEAATGRIIAGEDRLAALLKLGWKNAPVKLAEGTALELAFLQVEENLRRRQDDPDLLTKRYVDLCEQEIREAAITGQGARKLPDPAPGRPKTTRGAAREVAATKLRKTPEAIRRAETRAEAKTAPKEAPPEREAEWFEALPTGSLRGEVRVAIGVCETISQYLVNCQKVLAPSQLTALGGHLHQRLYQDLHALAEKTRALKPVAVCPACQAGNSALCQLCKGLSIVTQAQLVANKPKAKAAAKPTGKKNTIVLADGEVFDPAEEGGDF